MDYFKYLLVLCCVLTTGAAQAQTHFLEEKSTKYVFSEQNTLPIKLKRTIFEFNSRLSGQEEFDIVTAENVEASLPLNSVKIALLDSRTGSYRLSDIFQIPTRYGTAAIHNHNGWCCNQPNHFKGKLLYIAQTDSHHGKVDVVQFRLATAEGRLMPEVGEIRIGLDNQFDEQYDIYPNDDNTATAGIAIDLHVLNNDPGVKAFHLLEAYESPNHGTITVHNKHITYIPNEGYEGVDSFRYRIKGNNLYDVSSAPARVTIAVSKPNQKPKVSSINLGQQQYTTLTPISVSVTASDPDGVITSYLFQLNNEGWIETDQPRYAFDKLSEGSYRLKVKVIDDKGASSIIKELNFSVIKPQLQDRILISPQSDLVTSQQFISLSSNSDIAQLQYKVVAPSTSCANSEWQSYSAPFKLSDPARVCAKLVSSGWRDSISTFRDFDVVRLPSAPTTYSEYDLGSNEITIKWNPQPEDTRIQLQSKVSQSENWQTQREAINDDAIKLTRSEGLYSFRVRACNPVGCSAWSNPLDIVVVLDKPNHQCPAFL
ncbi:Ig-like domain-containing protein [Pseudoalteromonas sp. CnMc7-15]|uniref:Ig-like domain-containing protein n=1 Tax=unclassified Pseudoalteromonas TaxID=194690 RepID=UPI001EF6BD36|nr:Ig-like domain-containing protein [Pseudoalteromonas sp. CnMc7-15]MCG7566173.1 Ig-like domain-containing protein [Pseudoalteromonas sp. CnMc7-15]